jgi:hypothetical protein
MANKYQPVLHPNSLPSRLPVYLWLWGWLACSVWVEYPWWIVVGVGFCTLIQVLCRIVETRIDIFEGWRKK